jgi:predicted nuclease of predicted toxin-antitoxin system
MLKILIDQDFDHDILRGVIRRLPQVDFVTAFDAGLSDWDDEQLLLWASQNGRILVTHDRRTMPIHFAALLEQGENLQGVIISPRQLSIRQAIEELETIIFCSENEEWEDIVKILPL